jgi:hypothetical protein
MKKAQEEDIMITLLDSVAYRLLRSILIGVVSGGLIFGLLVWILGHCH